MVCVECVDVQWSVWMCSGVCGCVGVEWMCGWWMCCGVCGCGVRCVGACGVDCGVGCVGAYGCVGGGCAVDVLWSVDVEWGV